jgi:protein-S-isoprenylcysteine O-methyltransferase Ste14
MRATEFEFRHRFWFIVLIFAVAFGCYIFEPVDSVEWLLKLLGNSGVSVFPKAGHSIFALGAAVVAAAAWMRTWGTAYLNTEVVHDSAAHSERLVADGPYRYVRNPLYLGNILLAFGLCLMASPIGAVVLVAGMAFFVLRLVGYEEGLLLEKQGAAYQAFLERVPRLWPALRPQLPSSGAEPRWGQAWGGEMWMWAISAGSAAFAVTLNPKWFDYIVWGGFIFFYVPLRILIRRRAHGSPDAG